MIIRDLPRYDLNTVVQPGGMSRTDLNLSLRHQCLLRGASEHLWSLNYSSRKFSWGPAQSLYISLHLSTFSRVDSSLLFQIHVSWCNSSCELVRLAAADEVPSKETVTCLCNIKQRCHEPRMLDTESHGGAGSTAGPSTVIDTTSALIGGAQNAVHVARQYKI